METTLPAQIFRLTFFTTEILITSAASASIADYDYVTSIKVNDVDLALPLPASKANALISKNPVKLKYEYSECTGNTEFHVTSKGKFLKFEIYAEDNPQVKNDSFYKNKSSFAQLGQTKGDVWMEWDKSTQIRDKIQIGSKHLISQYDYQQFVKDFTKSAKLANPNEIAYVILLSPTHAKCVLKEPHNYDLPYIGNLLFNFKNSKLIAF